LISGGCSVKVVQKHLGHASAVEILDTYSHLWPEDDDRSRAAISAVLSSSCATNVQREADGQPYTAKRPVFIA